MHMNIDMSEWLVHNRGSTTLRVDSLWKNGVWTESNRETSMRDFMPDSEIIFEWCPTKFVVSFKDSATFGVSFATGMRAMESMKTNLMDANVLFGVEYTDYTRVRKRKLQEDLSLSEEISNKVLSCEQEYAQSQVATLEAIPQKDISAQIMTSQFVQVSPSMT